MRLTSTSFSRSKQAAWMKAHARSLQQDMVGAALVFTSSLVRCVLTAVLWLSKIPEHSCVVAATMSEAEEWVRRRYEEVSPQGAGLDLTTG
jgi:hypothetical protein